MAKNTKELKQWGPVLKKNLFSMPIPNAACPHAYTSIYAEGPEAVVMLWVSQVLLELMDNFESELVCTNVLFT